jgi:hypothetical protein
MSTARFLLFFLIMSLVGCERSQSTKEAITNISGVAMRPFEPALRQFDRAEAGFPPLPTNGTVKIETVDRQNWNREYPPPQYDVMLHFVEDPPGFRYSYCTVGFRKGAGGLGWIGEQDSFYGPQEYESDGVMVHEAVTITRETEQIAFIGTNISGTVFRYSGPVPRNLERSDADRMLIQWGYPPLVTNAQPDGAANGSQPVTSGTNRTSPAASRGWPVR